MKNYRNQKLAKRLALWAIADQIDHESVDKHVLVFSKQCEKDVSKLTDIENQMKKLKDEHKEITKDMIESSNQNILDLVNKTENEMAKPLVDLAFWNRIQEIDPNLYNVLHANLEELGDETDKEEE
jgi:hypothetical protein